MQNCGRGMVIGELTLLKNFIPVDFSKSPLCYTLYKQQAPAFSKNFALRGFIF